MENPPKRPEDAERELPDGHWFAAFQHFYEAHGAIPDRLQMRAQILIDALGLPSGEFSAVETDASGKRVNPERDRILAEYLTNKPGIVIDEEKGIVSHDFRDLYPDGLPQELRDALDSDTRAIMEAEYAHAAHAEKQFGDTGGMYETDLPTEWHRLEGGVSLFIRGYMHAPEWQERHGQFLAQANAHASVIAVEGFTNIPLGESLNMHISGDFGNDYAKVMSEAITAGFHGVFTEVDARDNSKIHMDVKTKKIDFLFGPSMNVFPDLPLDFFENYLSYFSRELPKLTEHIKTSEDLEHALRNQASTGDEGIFDSEPTILKHGRLYTSYPYLAENGDISAQPTFRELGQHLFSDALAAIKLHLIAKLMADGHLPKGPIIDYEGSSHLPSKTFFLRYPSYAMEVVLRTVNELMAGKGSEGDMSAIYKVFDNPDWAAITREIVKTPFKEARVDDEGNLIDHPVDVLATYHVDPETLMPSDEELDKLREKFIKAAGERREK